MGLLSGVTDVLKGTVKIATAPARAALGVAGTTLSTGGSVLSNVSEGDLIGAASAVGEGAQNQVGNVTGYFRENVDSVKQIAGGHVEFLQGGLNLLGAPVRGAARVAGAGLNAVGTGLSAAGAAATGLSGGIGVPQESPDVSTDAYLQAYGSPQPLGPTGLPYPPHVGCETPPLNNSMGGIPGTYQNLRYDISQGGPPQGFTNNLLNYGPFDGSGVPTMPTPISQFQAPPAAF